MGKKKASRSAIRVLSILSYAEAAVILAGAQADPITEKRVDAVRKFCQVATDGWTVIGQDEEVFYEVLLLVQQINVLLEGIWWLKVKPDMSYPGMLYIAIQLIDDLMGLISDRRKKYWLEDIHRGLTMLIRHIDPEGVMFLTQDRAQEVVNSIYSVIGDS